MDLVVEEPNSVIDIRKNRIRSNLLLHLYQSGDTSINKMARLFHASIPSATGIVNELIREGWIIETGTGPARAGRPPVLYGLNSKKYLTLIMDINRHDTQLVIFDLHNQLILKRKVDIRLDDSSTFLEQLFEASDDFLKSNNINVSKLWGIGVSMPGLINSSQGINLTYLNLTPPGVPLVSHLKKHFKLPVCLFNDTKATTIGEHRFGFAREKSQVLTINIDWGVGLGIIINGEVFNGASGFAGELGHIQVKPDGLLCHCGKIGCLDTITSAIALIRRAKDGINGGKATILSQIVNNNLDLLDTSHIIEAVHAGDEFSIDLLSTVGTELGKGLATAVHLFNPEVIIVGGLLAEAGPFISNPIEQAINKYCLSDFKNSLSIHISKLGAKARLLGTQAHLFEHLIAKEFS
ncbi:MULTISPECIES: ROK family transcriptional regulator [Dyadobacter]|jgi:N-acetylglucosamine repressor|uniref:ROK family protein n=1 Tax=Dyadobacter chenhuakuii TaxID=2909339 RepID=A0A9X1TU98_9BACT|nr:MULTISPECIES: ROK family transcriptional regulator [Dyadobacter]MCE7071812.1 ROK family protein [Dyadobacter sp. CY327]MCF2496358.1 ROK family protein [Dyadobacter chenhuakuii]MCF2501099.1 ROK family protein [Dyadobacter chenhuakuii]MCF2519475.1 ROK family protein [Dyadobacter sp. CY351]USJ30418.1 ROK family protein [Dyadobacter chenhuakuii]